MSEFERKYIPEESKEHEKKPAVSVEVDREKLAWMARDCEEESMFALSILAERLPERLDFGSGITLVTGPNGAGKSMFLKALFGAIELARTGRPLQDSLREKKRNPIPLPVSTIMSALQPNIKGVSQSVYRDYTAETGFKGDLFRGMAAERSHREVLDHVNALSREHGANLAFFDEPEIGMDARRHVRIRTELESFFPGSMIISTNSTVLVADTSLPRLELLTPERGVYTPDTEPEDVSMLEHEETVFRGVKRIENALRVHTDNSVEMRTNDEAGRKEIPSAALRAKLWSDVVSRANLQISGRRGDVGDIAVAVSVNYNIVKSPSVTTTELWRKLHDRTHVLGAGVSVDMLVHLNPKRTGYSKLKYKVGSLISDEHGIRVVEADEVEFVM